MGYPYDDNPPNWNDLNVQFDLGMARGDARRAEREAREAWATVKSWQNHAQKLELRIKQEAATRQALESQLANQKKFAQSIKKELLLETAKNKALGSQLAEWKKYANQLKEQSDQRKNLVNALRKENQELREAIQQGAKQRRIARCQINELINNVAGELWDLAYPEKSDPNVEANVSEFTELIEKAMKRGEIAGQEEKDRANSLTMENTLPHN